MLALLSKSVAIILPLVLFLYDLCYLKKSARKVWLTGKIPFLLASGATVLIALKSQMPEYQGGRISYDIEGPLGVFYTMLTVLARYSKNIVWPTELSAVYMPPMKVRIDVTVMWSALLALLLIAAGVYLYQKRKDLLLWFSFFFVGLLPVSQVVPIVTLMNDRYLYFSMLGAAACYGIMVFSPTSTARHSVRKYATVLLCLLVIPLPLLARQRTAVWSNDLSL